jgi:hypothetical protein
LARIAPPRRGGREEKTRNVRTLNYLQVPADDLEESATFHEQVFGWTVIWHPTEGKDYEQTSYPEFADSTGRNGGGFVLDRRRLASRDCYPPSLSTASSTPLPRSSRTGARSSNRAL